ncbi:MAG: hypothetical protein KDJ38_15585, partial [Gammaproteobacteria bacterium]|nr:hypothetical protein [Gammaproteobacteria bacterium]
MMPRNSNATTSTISCDDKNETTRTDDSFQGVFRKGKPEPAKVISIVARFSLGLLIPALYMLVLGAVAYVTFHHALFGLHFQRASSVVVNGFQYLLPLFSGAALLALLLRPFFPLRRREHRHYEMQDDNGRDLLTFAEKISQQMAIPSSLKLTFSLQPELHIKPDSPWRATRGHLTLTAGLPLLAVINTRQLGALISHQLAHHSNSILTPVQRTMTVLDRWFKRSISGDDGWLDQFQAFEQSSDNSLLVATGLVGKTAIIGSNYLLRGLYYLYKALSRPVLLSLEKDAD